MYEYFYIQTTMMNQEKIWNKKAKSYYQSQLIDDSSIVSQVIHKLKDLKVLLPKHRLIDIGGGTGRYAIPFAKEVNDVVITDVSKDMLQYAKVYANKHDVSNIKFIQKDWEQIDIKTQNWDNHFDVAFSSMSAATRNLDGLKKMMETSKKWCVLNQFTLMYDSIIYELKKVLGIENEYDPHEDKAYVKTVFDYLHKKDIIADILNSAFKSMKTYTVDEIITRYEGRFLSKFEEKGIDYYQFIKSLSKKNEIEVNKHTIMTTIVWHK